MEWFMLYQDIEIRVAMLSSGVTQIFHPDIFVIISLLYHAAGHNYICLTS